MPRHLANDDYTNICASAVRYHVIILAADMQTIIVRRRRIKALANGIYRRALTSHKRKVATAVLSRKLAEGNRVSNWLRTIISQWTMVQMTSRCSRFELTGISTALQTP